MSRKYKKNVIMVVLDTHRFDRIGAYGYQRPTTPNLDSIASESLFFERAVAPGQWTIPSHASIFSGEGPAVHMTVQADDVLPIEFQTLASRLSSTGIHTTGFCNNPLVGILQNGFKRGFKQFYNYSGVVPSTPQREIDDIWNPLRKLWTRYTQLLRRLSYPIQNAFASPNEFFLAALRPLFVPLWTRAANFKGMTERSIKDTTNLLIDVEEKRTEDNFVFLNMMETHLPYAPPDRFVKQFVPYFNETPEAQQFMREFNRNALQWLIPLVEPFSDVESTTLSDMYDAEVAYQDHLLAELISVLNSDYHREHSMVIFLADHGEMLGEHGYMGHGFGVHEALIRVPLFIRFPELSKAKRVEDWVSTTQLFYTVLDYFGFDTLDMPYAEEIDISCQSLLRLASQDECTARHVISEAYSPENSLRIMRNHSPALIDQYKADQTHRAVYQGNGKMITVEGLSKVLYDLALDPAEKRPYHDEEHIAELDKILDAYLDLSTNHRGGSSKQKITLMDDLMQQRLRDLGYLE
ncbi:MAG: sulfatase-like hydrolase/transferase [Chloroflexota bacterium]|nr:sulfatase-like hydrolase/transferase [Chloroflexota bacterium]